MLEKVLMTILILASLGAFALRARDLVGYLNSVEPMIANLGVSAES